MKSSLLPGPLLLIALLVLVWVGPSAAAEISVEVVRPSGIRRMGLEEAVTADLDPLSREVVDLFLSPAFRAEVETLARVGPIDRLVLELLPEASLDAEIPHALEDRIVVPVMALDSILEEASWDCEGWSSNPEGCRKGMFAQILLHEVGHLADRSDCGTGEFPYGPDGRHRGQEVLSPAVAFLEAWAHVASFRGPGGEQLHPTLVDLDIAYAESPLLREVVNAEGESDYPSLRLEDLRREDFLGCIRFVGGILFHLQGILPGGRVSLDDLISDTQEVGCRDLRTILRAAYGRFGDPIRMRLLDLLRRRTHGRFSDPELEQLFLPEDRLPPGDQPVVEDGAPRGLLGS